MSTKAFKNEKVEYFKSQFEKAKVAIVTDYRGLSVEEITNLRRSLQKDNSDFTVIKNTLCKLATKGTDFEAIEALLQGPNAIALDGKLLNAADAKKLAEMPTKEELYAKILGSINSPASGIVYTVNGVMSALVRAIDAVAKKKAS